MAANADETEATLYRLLEVSPNATFEEIESAYERLMAYLAVDSMALYSMGVDPEDVGEQRARVEEAFRVLSDPQLRAAYDGARRGGEDYPSIVVPGSHSGGDPSLSAGRLADEYDGGAGDAFDEPDDAGAAFTEDVLAHERAARPALPEAPSPEPLGAETKGGAATSIAVPASGAPTATPVGLATQATAVTTSGVVAPPAPAAEPAPSAAPSPSHSSAAPTVALLGAGTVAMVAAPVAGPAPAAASVVAASIAALPAPAPAASPSAASAAVGAAAAPGVTPALVEASAPATGVLAALVAAPVKAEPEASPVRRGEPAVLPAVLPAPLPRAEPAPLPKTEPAPLPFRREAVSPAPLPRDQAPAPAPVRVEPPPPKILPASARDRARPGRQRLYPTEVPPTITAETEINGGVLKRLRESCHATLEEVAAITKVNRRYLRAIEENDYNVLPAKVYVRGFVSEYARVLGLDPLLAANGFLRLFDRHRGGKEG